MAAIRKEETGSEARSAPAGRWLAALLALACLGLALHVATLGLHGLLRGPVFALFLLGAVLAAAGALAPRRWRARLLSLLVAGGLALAAAEGIESRWGPEAPVRLPETYDRRTKREVVLELRAQGIDAWPSVPCDPVARVPELDGRPTLPLGGISRVVTVHDNDNETGEFKVYESDRFGFNNPDGLWERAPLELALVGDSFTFGASVLHGRCYADLVRAQRPLTINLGMPGMGPLRELGVVREYLPHLRPRLVLWFWYEANDVDNLVSARPNEVLSRYVEEGYSQDLVARQGRLDRWLRARVERLLEHTPDDPTSRAEQNDARLALARRLELEALQRHLKRALTVSPREVLAAAPARAFPRALIRECLDDARREIAGWGGELVFVYLPGYPALSSGRPHPRRALVLELVRELGLDVVDLDPVFRAQPDPLALFPFHRLGHYDEAGNELVAREVLRYLDARG
jgi:hypothetical protein